MPNKSYWIKLSFNPLKITFIVANYDDGHNSYYELLPWIQDILGISVFFGMFYLLWLLVSIVD